MDGEWVRALASSPRRQPDSRSCGACVAVVAEARARRTPPASGAEFDAEVLHTHRALTGPSDAAGRMQLPWPRALGTPPWALARHLRARTGTAYDVVPARWDPARAAHRVTAALDAGVGVPLYVGSRTLPRHVLLALARTRAEGRNAGEWTVYDPATGRLRELPVAQWTGGRIAPGWPVAWCALVPVSPARR